MTDEEKAEEYVLYIPDTVDAKHSVYSEEKLKQAYLDGLEEGRNEKGAIIGAMELIKNYCIEITKKNGDCRKCIFCSKGYNGCKLQTSPNDWELSE